MRKLTAAPTTRQRPICDELAGVVFTRTVDGLVRRPVEEVFAFLEEPGSRVLYDEGVQSLELMSRTPEGVGSHGIIRMSFLGRHYERPWEVTEYEPPKKLVIASKARPFATWVGFELEGREQLTWVELSVTGRPGGLSRMLEPLMANSAERRLVRVLARLVYLLESQRSATTPAQTHS
jgi:polyketide cyclase/dehydrase/lipid transport protein